MQSEPDFEIELKKLEAKIKNAIEDGASQYIFSAPYDQVKNLWRNCNIPKRHRQSPEKWNLVFKIENSIGEIFVGTNNECVELQKFGAMYYPDDCVEDGVFVGGKFIAATKYAY